MLIVCNGCNYHFDVCLGEGAFQYENIKGVRYWEGTLVCEKCGNIDSMEILHTPPFEFTINHSRFTAYGLDQEELITAWNEGLNYE